ncbi:MAG: histidine phosphatase family protein [Pseudomonadales bacterium]|nr:histidine phosphatase family protein [Pseudomonadales bacterium]
MARQLILIRHGQIQANVDGHWHGSTDSPLNRTGRSQAKRVANYLSAQTLRNAAIYSSPLQRCQKTADSIASKLKLPVITEYDLREYSIGVLEGTPFADLDKDFQFFTRLKSNPEYAPDDGESIVSVASRMVPVFERINKSHSENEDVIIVSHGAAMGIAMATLLDSKATRWSDYMVANCSVSNLVLNTNPHLTIYNHTEHL